MIRPSNFLGLSCTALQHPPLSTTLPLLESLAPKYKDTKRQHDTMGESFLNFKCDTINRGSPASHLSMVMLPNYLKTALPLFFCLVQSNLGF